MIIQNTKPNIQSPKIADNPHTYSSKAIDIKPPNHFVYCPPQMRLLSRLLDRLSVLGILLTGLIHNQTHTYYHMIYIYPQAIWYKPVTDVCLSSSRPLPVSGRLRLLLAALEASHAAPWMAMWIMGSRWLQWQCGSWDQGWPPVRPREVHEIFSCSGVCSIAVSIC